MHVELPKLAWTFEVHRSCSHAFTLSCNRGLHLYPPSQGASMARRYTRCHCPAKLQFPCPGPSIVMSCVAATRPLSKATCASTERWAWHALSFKYAWCQGERTQLCSYELKSLVQFLQRRDIHIVDMAAISMQAWRVVAHFLQVYS